MPVQYDNVESIKLMSPAKIVEAGIDLLPTSFGLTAIFNLSKMKLTGRLSGGAQTCAFRSHVTAMRKRMTKCLDRARPAVEKPAWPY